MVDGDTGKYVTNAVSTRSNTMLHNQTFLSDVYTPFEGETQKVYSSRRFLVVAERQSEDVHPDISDAAQASQCTMGAEYNLKQFCVIEATKRRIYHIPC